MVTIRQARCFVPFRENSRQQDNAPRGIDSRSLPDRLMPYSRPEAGKATGKYFGPKAKN